jgi:DNA-binding transcriptional MerR regulator
MKYCRIFVASILMAAVASTAQALTVDEILLLKENGVSEKTIQMMLENEARTRTIDNISRQPGVQTIVRPNGRPAIVYSTGRDRHVDQNIEEQRKEERAWEMLRHLIVDTRHP